MSSTICSVLQGSNTRLTPSLDYSPEVLGSMSASDTSYDISYEGHSPRITSQGGLNPPKSPIRPPFELHCNNILAIFKLFLSYFTLSYDESHKIHNLFIAPLVYLREILICIV